MYICYYSLFLYSKMIILSDIPTWSRNSHVSLGFVLWLQLKFPPWSVPRVWSLLGLAEPAACIPVILTQGKSAAGSGSKPHRELWNVHSLSAGHDPFTLLQTWTSSRAILPSVPPKIASKMNFTHTYKQNVELQFTVYFVCDIYTETQIQYLYWAVIGGKAKVRKAPFVALCPSPSPHDCLCPVSVLRNKSERACTPRKKPFTSHYNNKYVSMLYVGKFRINLAI